MTLARLDQRRRAFADAMDAQGAWPADSQWVRRAILDTVPRHQFASDRLWTWNGHAYVPVDRATDPDGWADLVYAGPDDSAITQILDGLPSSSPSCASVVADMADSLDANPDHLVLELGAGQGWNSGILATRVGAGKVTTVEVDADLADATRHRLAAAGLDVAVHTGDGNAGWPASAPYDRVIATYAVDLVPWTWIEQTKPGGRLVIPWGRLGHVALTVADDGKSATGWVQGLATFMPSRGVDQGRELHAVRGDGPPDRAVRLDHELRPLLNPHLLFALRVSHPDIRITTKDTGEEVTVDLHDGINSWATATTDCAGNIAAYEGGPRKLFAEVAAGQQLWAARAMPSIWDFGMTVTLDGQYVWAGSADSGPYRL
ncbi:methyltransferase domain-containing protein [Streptomyces sp. 5.8]|uniref:methyltransferase domain-containing protein n=1 Tax=Streptomyces sp. 5.8 TaxID=3406571 RepID=UPI003BB667C7